MSGAFVISDSILLPIGISRDVTLLYYYDNIKKVNPDCHDATSENAGPAGHWSHWRRLGGSRAALRYRCAGRGRETGDGKLDPRRGGERGRGAFAADFRAAAAKGHAS